MSLATASRTYPQVRAPHCHGAAVVEPPFSESTSLILGNRTQRNVWDTSIAGEPLGELIDQARAHLVREALTYTHRYRDISFACGLTSDVPLIVCGHQPELFHAGVWFKNFAMHRIAHENHGLGIHLLIDNDLLRQRNLLVPTGTPQRAEAKRIAFDTPLTTVPYEEAHVENADLFCSFPGRVAAALRPFVTEPVLSSLWPHVLEANSQGGTIGSAFAAARHRIEGEWGLETLEVPLSRLCQSHIFRLVTALILTQLDHFRTLYNSSLSAFRKAHRLRSHSHPVPALTRDGNWLEAPFWIWHRDKPTRQALFVRHAGGKLQLRAGREGQEFEIAALDQSSSRQSVDQLVQLEGSGTKLRPRALITTMYARLFLSDLFLHGIGGGKYDQLTDRLIEAFWGIEPPVFMVMSATVRMPFSRPLVEPDDIRQVDGLIRQLWFHPELVDLDGASSELAQLAQRKSHLVASPPTTGARKSWHDQIESINARLREMVKAKHEDLLEEKASLHQQAQHDKHLASREYSFSLLPESQLKKSLLDLSKTIA